MNDKEFEINCIYSSLLLFEFVFFVTTILSTFLKSAPTRIKIIMKAILTLKETIS